MPEKETLGTLATIEGSSSCKVLNGVLLEMMKEAVDPKLRDQQAGFRRNKSCADQILNLRIIVEQSLE